MAAGVLVNTTLSNLIGGVTQQYQEGRFDSQVTNMLNCIPSITRGVLRRNPLTSVADILAGLPISIADAFVYTYDRGTTDEQYIVVVPGDGSMFVYNVNTGVRESDPITGHAYLTCTGRAKEVFKSLTIGDHTFIVNSEVEPAYSTKTAPTLGYADKAFYWIKKTTSVVYKQYQDSTDVGTLSRGYTYQLNSYPVQGETDSRPGAVDPELGTSEKIAANIAANASGATTSYGSVAYTITAAESTEWNWTDTFGDAASLGVHQTIDDAKKLPVNLPSALDGFIVRVAGGTSAEYDDYFLQYSLSSKRWIEVAGPGEFVELDSSTMPHVLYRLGGDTWEFNTYQGVDISTSPATTDGVSQWGERESGGSDSTLDPSFIGNRIVNLFFFKNRLGFITNDSVVLSRTSDYGNFFIQTVQDTLDDDPLDLAVASTDVTVLRHAVPTTGQLLLFSDDTQFSLTSLEGPLTPTTADITALSHYTYSNKAQAKSIGNKVYFSNQAGNYSQLFSYRITDQGSKLTEASPMTLHLPTYISNTISNIIGHDVLGYTFIEDEGNPKDLIVLSSVTKASEDLQNAFHKWTFTKDIVHTAIINNDLYIIFDDSNLVKMSLEVPGSINDKDYLDNYSTTNNVEEYDSHVEFSEFFVRDAAGKGTVRGRYQLRTLQYTIAEDSSYKTTIESIGTNLFNEDTMYGTTWEDTDAWEDTMLWVEVNPAYERVYKNDDKVTIMANSKLVKVVFGVNEDATSKGFELSTVNIEGFFHQRSSRTK